MGERAKTVGLRPSWSANQAAHARVLLQWKKRAGDNNNNLEVLPGRGVARCRVETGQRDPGRDSLALCALRWACVGVWECVGSQWTPDASDRGEGSVKFATGDPPAQQSSSSQQSLSSILALSHSLSTALVWSEQGAGIGLWIAASLGYRVLCTAQRGHLASEWATTQSETCLTLASAHGGQLPPETARLSHAPTLPPSPPPPALAAV